MELLICPNTKHPLNDYNLQDTMYDYNIYVKNQKNIENIYSYDQYKDNDNLCIFFGKLYFKVKQPARYINDFLQKNQDIKDIDGDFIYAIINRLGNITVFSDREGIIPIYYCRDKNKTLSITTCQQILFENFKKQDIDTTSINDFLRFGTLLGDKTFSENIKLIEGGTKLEYIDNKVIKQRYHLFHFNEMNAIDNLDELIKKISKSYIKAIQKRITIEDINDSCIFMSGGIDSRFLLAMTNHAFKDNRIHTYTFGQLNSEEVDIARKCASIKNNPFHWIQINPSDFITNINLYSQITCGADMFPQSYIIDATKKITQSKFFTGFVLDVLLGGTFLNTEAISSQESLSEFVTSNLKLTKMNALSDEILKKICKKGIYDEIFGQKNKHLIEVAKEYDKYSICDGIQSFAINNRDKRLVLMREMVPSIYKNYSCISLDKDFLNVISLIPAKYRNNHCFYQKLFMEVAPEYANIVYNNTTLPISANIDLWKSGSKNELNREKLFQEIMKESNGEKDNPNYYPHYYSDFDGYSRYDRNWIELIKNSILNDGAIINNLWFEKSEIQSLYKDHLSGEYNYRKELIYLVTMEIFLKNFLINEGDIK